MSEKGMMRFCKKHSVDYNIKLGCPYCRKEDKMTLCVEDRLVAKKLGYMLVKRKDLQEIKRLLEQECTKLANPMINKLEGEYGIE